MEKILFFGPSFPSEEKKLEYQKRVENEIKKNTKGEIDVFFFCWGDGFDYLLKIIEDHELKGVIFAEEIPLSFLLSTRGLILKTIQNLKKDFYPSFFTLNPGIDHGEFHITDLKHLGNFVIKCYKMPTYL